MMRCDDRSDTQSEVSISISWAVYTGLKNKPSSSDMSTRFHARIGVRKATHVSGGERPKTAEVVLKFEVKLLSRSRRGSG